MIETAECTCGVIAAEVHQCQEHFRLWRHGKRLTSVSRIIGAILPTDWSKIDAAVLENARHRGEQVDRLFSAYVLGNLSEYPVGTRNDAMVLFERLQEWYDRQNFKSVQAQVVLGCEDHGGVMDLRLDGVPVELKATSRIEESHLMQTACYAYLDGGTDWHRKSASILHVTERQAKARLIPLMPEDFRDWKIMLAAWRMIQRRKPSKGEPNDD